MDGMLLERNKGSATAPHPAYVDANRDVDSGLYDPTSENFVVPPGIIPTPRGLAIFFTQEMRKHYDSTGRRWTSLNDYRAYLRPAKILLDEVGFESAVRNIVYAIRVANHTPSFKFVLRCARCGVTCQRTGSTR